MQLAVGNLGTSDGGGRIPISYSLSQYYNLNAKYKLPGYTELELLQGVVAGGKFRVGMLAGRGFSLRAGLGRKNFYMGWAGPARGPSITSEK